MERRIVISKLAMLLVIVAAFMTSFVYAKDAYAYNVPNLQWPLAAPYTLDKSIKASVNEWDAQCSYGIPSKYGWRDLSMSSEYNAEFHDAIDIWAKEGTPVYAAAAGKVKMIKRASSADTNPHGNSVLIDHGGGCATRYSHMKGFASGIKIGSSVRKGQVIGYVGHTGRATGDPRSRTNKAGNHLDFAIVSTSRPYENIYFDYSALKWKTDSVNPMYYFGNAMKSYANQYYSTELPSGISNKSYRYIGGKFARSLPRLYNVGKGGPSGNAVWNFQNLKLSVTFKDGYTSRILKSQVVSYGQSASAPATPKRTGYVFAGWSGNYSNVSANTIVVAKWARPAKVDSGVVGIKSALSSTPMLDVAGGSKANGTNVQIYKNNRTKAQQWKFMRNSDATYTIINPNSGLVLDVAGGNMSNGTNIRLWKRNNTAAQKWVLLAQGSGFVIASAKNPNFCIDVANGKNTNSTNVRLWVRNGTKAQLWYASGNSALSTTRR